MPAQDEKFQIILQELVRRTNDGVRRLRGIEQRVQAVESRLNSLEESGLARIKKINEKFTESDIQTRNINDEMMKIKNSLEKITRQLSTVAYKKDIKEIENMFDLLSPVKQEFVTRDELKELEEGRYEYRPERKQEKKPEMA
ncbi:MAG: hypothetical protein V1802_02430 [Candidatus Aenigmatarchaeota archaeon]